MTAADEPPAAAVASAPSPPSPLRARASSALASVSSAAALALALLLLVAAAGGGAALSAFDAAAALASALAVLAWYAACVAWLLPQPWARGDARARSWLISLLVSAVMTAASLPTFSAVLASDDAGFVALTHAETPVTRGASIFFAVATALDLAVGRAEYPQELGLVSGYVHHLAFVALAYLPLTTRSCSAFVALCVAELPTLVLALGSVVPALRSDVGFGASFFLLRVCFTSAALAWFWRLATLRYVVATTAFSVLLNAVFFVNWVRGMMRRRQRRQGADDEAGAAGKAA